MKNEQLSDLEKFGYYLMCVLTLGYWWFIKVLIKKAIVEAKK